MPIIFPKRNRDHFYNYTTILRNNKTIKSTKYKCDAIITENQADMNC